MGAGRVDQRFDLVVIGGGPAGVTAALRARELDATVALVERGSLGGTCTNDGCVPTRVLARAARLLRDAEQYSEYGLTGEVPVLDFRQLLDRAQRTVYRVHEKKQLLGHLVQAGVEVRDEVDGARFAERETLQLGTGERITGDRFLICAGGHARRLSLPGAELALTHSDIWGMSSLPGSVAIVGGAATGCQLASVFAAFGSQVTLLDLAPRLVPGEDELVSEVLTAAFRARGMTVETGIGGLTALEKTAGGLTLRYAAEGAGGSGPALEVDTVVFAVGWPGNLEALGLDVPGVETERGYVVVDDELRTSAPHVWAAGDITGRMMLVQSAAQEARAAAENALAVGDGRRHLHRVVPHGGFTDPEYGSVGLAEMQAAATEDVVAAVVPYAELDRAVIDGHPDGACKLIASRRTGLLLGCHVVGEQAVEVVQIVAAGIAAGMTVRALAELQLAYPTFTAIVGLAARRIVGELEPAAASREWQALGSAAEWERRATDVSAMP